MAARANILVVDDDLGPRESMRMILKNSHNIYTAENGETALRVIKDKPIDLITLDLKMPGMQGIDVLKEIRRFNTNVEVIIVTGYGTLHTATEAMKLGINGYITKPYNVNDITSLVDKAIEHRKFNLKLKHFFQEALFSDGEEEEEETDNLSPLNEGSLADTDISEDLLDVTELKFKRMKKIKNDFSREIKELEERLVRSEKLSMVGQLAAGYAHELNNKLNTISGYAEFLHSKISRSSPELSDLLNNLETISNQIEQASRFTSNILNLSRKNPTQKEPTDVKKLIERVLLYVEHLSHKKEIKIMRDYESHLPLIYVDPGKVEQVFLNLIINAFHAVPEGGNLSIKANRVKKEMGDLLRLEFTDSGHGIAEKDIKKIFEPFFSTKGEGVGTGLGLFISRRIVESFHGSIEVVSKENEGTTFIIEFPVLMK
jgi:signal transduction histidine kinase